MGETRRGAQNGGQEVEDLIELVGDGPGDIASSQGCNPWTASAAAFRGASVAARASAPDSNLRSRCRPAEQPLQLPEAIRFGDCELPVGKLLDANLAAMLTVESESAGGSLRLAPPNMVVRKLYGSLKIVMRIEM